MHISRGWLRCSARGRPAGAAPRERAPRARPRGAAARLVLLKVVAHDGQPAGAEQVAVHELPRGLKVAAQADADQRQVASGREEVAALQEARHPDLAHDRQACAARPARSRRRAARRRRGGRVAPAATRAAAGRRVPGQAPASDKPAGAAPDDARLYSPQAHVAHELPGWGAPGPQAGPGRGRARAPSLLKQKRMSSTSSWRCGLRRRPMTMPRQVVTCAARGCMWEAAYLVQARSRAAPAAATAAQIGPRARLPVCAQSLRSQLALH